MTNRPALIIFDDLDLLTPANQEQEVLRSTQIAEFLIDSYQSARLYCESKLIDGIMQPISIIATSQNLAALHESLRDTHFFSCEVELNAPNHLGRVQVNRLVSSNTYGNNC